MSVASKTAVLEHLGRQHQAMVTLLAELVNIDFGSYNKRGVDAVGDRLRAYLEAAGISCEIFPNETFGDCIAARLPASGGGNRPIVLMGHRDTVFPDDTAVNTVAARASAAIDVRFPTLNIMEKVLGEVREICRCCELPGSEGRILHEGNFLPLEQDEKSRELLDCYGRSAADLGFLVSGEATGVLPIAA